MRKSIILLLFASIFFMLSALGAQAQVTFSWTGGAVGAGQTYGYWSNPGNWGWGPADPEYPGENNATDAVVVFFDDTTFDIILDVSVSISSFEIRPFNSASDDLITLTINNDTSFTATDSSVLGAIVIPTGNASIDWGDVLVAHNDSKIEAGSGYSGNITISGSLSSNANGPHNFIINAGSGNLVFPTGSTVSNFNDLTLSTTTGNLDIGGSSFSNIQNLTITSDMGGNFIIPNIDISGNLTINMPNVTEISSNNTIKVGGTFEIASRGEITLNNANNDFNIVTTTSAIGGDTHIVDVDDIILGNFNSGGNNLRIAAGGSITQVDSTAINIGGIFEIASGGAITLNNANNDFNVVKTTSAVGGDTHIVDVNNIVFGDFDSGGNNLRIAAGGSITQVDSTAINIGGIFEIASGGAITLNNANNDFNVVTTTSAIGGHTHIVDVDDIILGNFNSGGNNLRIAAGGSITQIIGLTINIGGTFEIASGGAITLTNANNDFNVVTTTSAIGGHTHIVDVDDIILGNFNSGGKNLRIAAGGTITQNTSTAINIGGTFEIASGGAITLNNANNDFDIVTTTTTTTSAVGGDTHIVDVNNIVFGNFYSEGNNLRIDAGGSITQVPNNIIKTSGLAVEGSGPVILTENNEFAFFASNVVDDVIVKDNVGGFTITKTLISPSAADTDPVTAKNFVFESSGGTVFNGPPPAHLNAPPPNAPLSAQGLVLKGSGPFLLTNSSNEIGTLAADITGASNEQFIVSNNAALAVGEVTWFGGNSMSGITYEQHHLTLIARSGGLAINQKVSTTLSTSSSSSSRVALFSYDRSNGISLTADVDVQGGTLILDSGDGVTQENTSSITGNGLFTNGDGSFMLTGGSNNFNSLAVSTGSSQVLTLEYNDSDDLEVGSVSNASGTAFINGISSNGGDVRLATPGSLTISQAIDTVPNPTSGNTVSGTIHLDSAAGVTQTAALTGNGLLLEGNGTFTLEHVNNDMDILAASISGGTLTYKDSDGLTVGSISDASGTPINGISSNGNDVRLETAVNGIAVNGIAVNQAIAAGSGTIRLNSADGVTQDALAAAALTGNGLLLEGIGTFTLENSGNSIATLAASITGAVMYKNATALVVASVPDASGTLINGITTNGGDVRLATVADGIAVNQAIAAGSGTIRLDSAAGATQTAALTGSGLLLEGNGTFTLEDNGNNISTLAAAAGTSALTLTYKNSTALTLGPVLDASGTSINGISSNDGDVTLETTSGSIAVNQAVAAGTGDIRLNSVAGVSQDALAALTGSGLLLEGNGAFTLDNGGNAVDILATFISGGNLTYTASAAFEIGSVPDAGGTFVNGIISNGSDVTLATTVGGIAVNQAIAAGIGTIRLNSAAGATQTAAITGSGLLLEGNGTFTLEDNGNNINTLAAAAGTSALTLTYKNSTALTLGTVLDAIGTPIDGISSNGGDVRLATVADGIAVNQAIAAVSGTIHLDSAAGVTQTAALTGNGLLLEGNGTFTLEHADNAIATLAASISGGALTYKDSDGLTVGSISDASGTPINGISSTGNDVRLETAVDGIAVNQAIAAGSGDIRLNSAGGVTQTAALTGSNLLLEGNGAFTLENSGNSIATLAASTTGAVMYKNSTALVVASVPDAIGTPINGIITNGSDVTLATVADGIAVNQAIAAGSGTIRLDSAAGATQTAALTGSGLLLEGNGTFTLEDNGNNINTLAAAAGTSALTLTYKNSTALTLGPVLDASGTPINGISSNDGDVTLETTSGSIAVNQAVAAGTGDIRLNSVAGVSQDPLAALTGGGLLLEGNGAFTLDNGGNAVDILATFISGGNLTYTASAAFEIGSVPDAGGTFVNGIISNGSDVTLATTVGGIVVNQAIAAGIGTIRLNSADGVTQTAAITGDDLLLEGNGTFTLEHVNNDMDILAASISGGTLTYKDSDGLTVGSISDASGTASIDGITTNGSDVTLATVTDGIAVNQAIAAGIGTIRLNSADGVTQTAALTGNGLLLEGNGTFTLEHADNAIATLAASIPGGTLTYKDSDGLTVGSISDASGTPINGIITNGGDVRLATVADGIAVNQVINAGSGTIRLNSADGVTQDALAAAALTGNGLLLEGNGTFKLENSGNSIATLAASITGAVMYKNATALVVASVPDASGTLINGITTNGGDVRLATVAGAIAVNQVINAGSGTIRLNSADGVTQDALAVEAALTGNGLLLEGNGTFTLEHADNAIAILAASIPGGTLTYKDSDGLEIGSVPDANGAAIHGITTTSLTLDAGGNLYFNVPRDNGNVINNTGTILNLTNPIVLKATGTLLSPSGLAMNSLDDDGNENSLTIISQGNIQLNGDIGRNTPPNDIVLNLNNGSINSVPNQKIIISGDLSIMNAAYTMNDPNQGITAGRHIRGTGRLNIGAGVNITAAGDITIDTMNITAGANITAAGNITTNLGIGNINGPPYATISVGGNFEPGAFTHVGTDADDSQVIFYDDPGDLVSQGGAYTFHNLTFADPDADVLSTGDWKILGDLTMAAGNWVLVDSANVAPDVLEHEIHKNWDSSDPNFSFDAAGSTIVFAGDNNASLQTGSMESFNNITFNKNPGFSVTMADSQDNTLDVAGNLTISSGSFTGRTSPSPGIGIRVAGDWSDTTTSGDGFKHQTEEVEFVGGKSNIHPGEGTYPDGYFWQLSVTDSEAVLINNPLVVGDTLSLKAEATPALLTTNAQFTAKGDLSLNATAAPALLTTNAQFTVEGDLSLKATDAPARLTTNAQFTAKGKVALLGLSGAVIDFTNQDFYLEGGADSLDASLGEIRLTGEQANQGFPSVSPGNEVLYGLVTYYDGADDGHIRGTTDFWNLSIDAPGRILNMTNDITVWGKNNPNGDGTLNNNSGIDSTSLNGLRILNGTLSAENGTDQYDIKLYGSMITADEASYHWGDTPIDHPNGAAVEFLGSSPAYIAGNNTFFRFVVNTGVDEREPLPADPNVAGKNLYFKAGSTTSIANNPNARFIAVGNEPDDQWINLLSGTNGEYWYFQKAPDAVAVMRYVYVQDSNATDYDIVIQIRVDTSNSPGWFLSDIFIVLSETRDQLRGYKGILDMDNGLYQPNGRIDRILVTVLVDILKDFSDFSVEVEGYEVLGFDPGDDPDDHEVLGPNQFWIILEEGDYPDTGATPAWRILKNTSLLDMIQEKPIAFYSSKTKEISYDGAPPIVGYTLSVVDSPRNEVFVYFSEPIVDTSTAQITPSNFNTAVGGGIASLTRVTPLPALGNNGMQEVILNLNGPVASGDVTANALNLTLRNIQDIPSPSSTLPDDADDPVDTAMPLVSAKHRISDIALGILGNGIVQPVIATGEAQSTGIMETLTRFDGSEYLQSEDIVLQAHRYTGEDFTPVLYWEDSNLVSSSYKNNGLWLPEFDEIANSGGFSFTGLVPRPWTPGPTVQLPSEEAFGSEDLFEYVWSSNAKITDGATLDFFFLTNTNLYAARCEDETATNWYRRIRPWTLKIKMDIGKQAGGITIANNIINPKNNEKATLFYELSRGGMVTVQVFDLAGGLVAVLQRGYQDAGEYRVSWDGRNRSGRIAARGIYFIRCVGPGGMDQIRKVQVLK